MQEEAETETVRVTEPPNWELPVAGMVCAMVLVVGVRTAPAPERLMVGVKLTAGVKVSV